MASINLPYSGAEQAAASARSNVKLTRHAHEAYDILHLGFVVAPWSPASTSSSTC